MYSINQDGHFRAPDDGPAWPSHRCASFAARSAEVAPIGYTLDAGGGLSQLSSPQRDRVRIEQVGRKHYGVSAVS